MATEAGHLVSVERSSSEMSPSLRLQDRSDSLSQLRSASSGSFHSDARLHSSSDRIDLERLRISLDDIHENCHESPQPSSSRPSTSAEPSLSKPPTGFGRHRRAMSSISLQKLDQAENGGQLDRTASLSPYSVSHSRSRSGNFGRSEIMPGHADSGRKSLDEAKNGRRTYTWEEKGKGVAYQSEQSFVNGRRSKRYSVSQASSRASSPRSVRIGPTSSRAVSPRRRSLSSSSMSFRAREQDMEKEREEKTLALSKEVKAYLADGTTEKKIWALRKIQLDTLLCKLLADDDRAVAAIMKCVQPARSWLPQVGCTDLQFHAVIACKHLARHNVARRKIAGDDNYKGIEALINLLRTGSLEAQSHTAHALACLAEDPSLSFAIGQKGGCAAIVAMLPTRTGLQNSYVSVEMAVDHEAAQANATLALANLAGATGNQQKMVEAGAIASLLLCLSPGLAATQASAAKCLHKLSKDEEYHALIIKAGALHALLQLLAADDTEPTPRAAATEAVGGIITSDKMAAETIPYLVSMMAAESLKVKLAATRALADLAHKSKFNRTKIAEEVDCIPTILDQLRLAEAQLSLVSTIQTRCLRSSSSLQLVPRLRDFLGEQSFRAVQAILQQLDMTLTNKMDSETLVRVFRENAHDHQRAAVRLLQSLSLRGFSQSRVLAVKNEVVKRVSKLLRSEVVSIRSKALACLASIAAQNPRLVQSSVESMVLINCVTASETKTQALRLLLNLATDEPVLKNLVNIGVVPLVIEGLTSKNPDVQFLASSCLANMTGDDTCRDLIMETCGLEQLCKMLFGKNVKALGPAAQTLWQLIEDSQEGSKIAQSIQSLGGHKGAVQMLNVEDTDVREQGTALIASLAKCDQETAELLAREGATGHMIALLHESSVNIKVNALEALGYLATASESARHMIVGPSGDMIDTFLRLMTEHKDPQVRIRAATCLASLSETPYLANILDEKRFTSNVMTFLLHSETAQERRTAIRALGRHAIHSEHLAGEWMRLGGAELLDELQNVQPDEKDVLARSLHTIASTPRTPTANAEELEKYDNFMQSLPAASPR